VQREALEESEVEHRRLAALLRQHDVTVAEELRVPGRVEDDEDLRFGLWERKLNETCQWIWKFSDSPSWDDSVCS
jgi:hypothetical protein